MKKKMLSLIIGMVLLVGIVSAVALFNNREEAFAYLKNIYKPEREAKIEKLVTTITYTTDKECEIDYSSEEVFCNVCFKYGVSLEDLNISRKSVAPSLDIIDDYVIFPDCIDLDEYSSEEEDNEKVVGYVKKRLNSLIPIEEIGYKARDMKDRIIEVISK